MTAFIASYQYAILFTLALVAGLWICESHSREPEFARRAYLIGAWSGLAGARLGYAAQYGGLSLTGGLSIWGFMAGAALGVAAYSRLKLGGWGFGDFPDAAAPAIAFGSAVQRVGCFLAGCCFGKPATAPWAVRYGPGTPAFQQQVAEGMLNPSAAGTLPVHPTQLYQSAGMLVAFFLLLWAGRSLREKLRRYEMILALAVYGSLFRFLIEYFRDDAGGRRFGPFTFAQGISLLVMVLAAAVLMERRARARVSAHPANEPLPVP